MVDLHEITWLDPESSLKAPTDRDAIWDTAACKKALAREIETGKSPKKPPRGYDKYKKYMERVVRHDHQTAMKSSRAHFWEIVDKSSKICAIIAAVAAVLTFVLTLWFGLYG